MKKRFAAIAALAVAATALVGAGAASANPNQGGGQETCPTADPWTKIETEYQDAEGNNVPFPDGTAFDLYWDHDNDPDTDPIWVGTATLINGGKQLEVDLLPGFVVEFCLKAGTTLDGQEGLDDEDVTNPVGKRGGQRLSHFSYIVTFIEGGPDPEFAYETAFAYGDDDATCFSEYGISRWGWTNGPLDADDAPWTWDVRAGAAHCGEGTLAGTVEIDVEDGVVTADFTAEAGVDVKAEHLYYGCDPLPTGNNGQPTVAPGSYEKSSENVSGCLDSFYVIYHNVVGFPTS